LTFCSTLNNIKIALKLNFASEEMLVQLNEHKFVKAVDIVLRNLRQVQNVLEFFGIRFCFFSFLFFPNFQIVVLFSASQ